MMDLMIKSALNQDWTKKLPPPMTNLWLTDERVLPRNDQNRNDYRLATAVPDVVTTAAACRVPLAMPRAMKAATRSSKATDVRIPGCRAKARVSGVEREPGEITA